MKPQHIILVTNSLSVGGIERNVRTVANNLSNAYSPEVWTLEQPPKSLDTRVPIVVFKRIAKFDPLLVLRLSRLLRKNPAKIIHFWHFTLGVHTLIANLLLSKNRRKRMVFSFGSARSDSRVISWYFRQAGIYADWITGNSPSVIEGLKNHGVSTEKMELLPNGHDSSVFKTERSKNEIRQELNLPDDLRIVITTGRLTPTKRHCDLLNAMAILRERGIAIKLLVLGDGELAETLRKQSIDQGIAE